MSQIKEKPMTENNRILIIDDDPGIRDCYKSILSSPLQTENVLSKGASIFNEPVEDSGQVSQKQYDLVLTMRGEEGIEAVEKAVEKNAPFAAAFIDIKMPGIDGAETAKQIWKIDPNVKIAIVTAYSEHTPDDIVIVTGRDDVFYLRKPFNSEEIRQFARAFTNQWCLERERKLLGDKLKRANEELEDIVKQRTEELKQAYKKLSGLDKDKITFLKYLSHEMNTPLGWIGVTQAMDQEELSEENKEMVAMVETGFERLNSLIKAVLSYFELAGSDLSLNLKKVSIQQLISDSINQKKDMIENAGLEIITRVQNEHSINIDPEYFIELLMILLDNAIVFSESGGTITVEVESAEDKTMLIITDNGRGIEKEILENIFKPFAIEEFNRHERGYGLNLPKVKIIAEAHGWHIRAESDGKDCGSRFVIEM